MKASGLVIEGLNKSSGDVHVVKDLNLTVEPGQFLVLLGPSGCGKTTALRMIAGLEEAADPDNSKKEFSWAACERVV